jgi:hypothetical protein
MENRFCISLLTLILMLSSCSRWPDTGNLRITVTYPEAVLEGGTISWIPVPADGASAKLFEKNATCLGFKNARMGIGHIGDDIVIYKFKQVSDEKGEIVFNGLPVGEYFLTLTAWDLSKYSEKRIEIIDGETLELVKNFTEDHQFYEKLEPWDYEVPNN